MTNRTTPAILNAVGYINEATKSDELAALPVEALAECRADLQELQRCIANAQRRIETAAVAWAIDNHAPSLLSVDWKQLRRR